MVIIIASSWAGKPIFANGESSRSRPSVKAIGVVVSVMSDVPDTSSISLSDIYTA